MYRRSLTHRGHFDWGIKNDSVDEQFSISCPYFYPHLDPESFFLDSPFSNSPDAVSADQRCPHHVVPESPVWPGRSHPRRTRACWRSRTWPPESPRRPTFGRSLFDTVWTSSSTDWLLNDRTTVRRHCFCWRRCTGSSGWYGHLWLNARIRTIGFCFRCDPRPCTNGLDGILNLVLNFKLSRVIARVISLSYAWKSFTRLFTKRTMFVYEFSETHNRQVAVWSIFISSKNLLSFSQNWESLNGHVWRMAIFEYLLAFLFGLKRPANVQRELNKHITKFNKKSQFLFIRKPREGLFRRTTVLITTCDLQV